MRTVTNFFVIKTTKQYPDVEEESRKIGFLYPSPHLYLYKFEEMNPDEEWKHIKSRPLCEPCALIRDSSISRSAIGIMIYSPSGDIHPGSTLLVANIINLISDDLGIKNFGILTDEMDSTRSVDVSAIYAAVARSPSIYTKRI